MLIVFSGDGEVIVTTSEKEVETIREWFIKGGRDLDNYEREEIADEAVSFGATIRRW